MPDSRAIPRSLKRALDGYLAQLSVERGLSGNTVAAYSHDLTRYLEFLARHGVEGPESVAPEILSAYQWSLTTGDEEHTPLAASSVARAVVAVRNLHAFMAQEGLSPANSAADMVVPKLGRQLPKALSINQVQTLIDSV